ncbi:MAG: 50S ribosomal protein L21 [Ignavibacteriaceae bacterium]|nr:50S ribosomal protein L21 [Ignavibacteriaceae bacterium]
MFAVVDIKGHQFKVSEKAVYFVPKIDAEVDSSIKFDSVLLYNDGKATKVGSPYINGLAVSARVIEQVKDDKVIIFKKKRRTGYKKKRGHRQQLTKIEITKIG